MIGDRRLWPFYSANARSAVGELVAAGETYASGSHPAIVELEDEFGRRHRIGDRRGLFVGSGTAALLAAYFAMDLPPASEVLVPVQTFHATVSPLLWLGLRPVFCRCEVDTGLIDLDDVDRRIGPGTSALVVTHLWGQLVDMAKARALCDRRGLRLIEDCSHAHGACTGGVVQLADASAYSLGTKKIVSGGIGGMVVVPAGQPFDRAVLLTQPAPRALELVHEGSALRGYADTGLGMNLRGSPISATLALDHLTRLDDICARKNETLACIAELLAKHLASVHVAPVPVGSERTLYALPMWLDDAWERRGQLRDVRDRLVELLVAEGFRAVASSEGLTERELFRRPGILPISGAPPLHPQVDGERSGASGLRFDTRDMYETWTSADLREAESSLVRVARALAA